MYQIYADDELIYDSGSREYKIGKENRRRRIEAQAAFQKRKEAE